MTPPRFRQSHAKILLQESPAVLRRSLVTERDQTDAMRAGSLLDMLTFRQDDRYEIVDARYLSGDRIGEPCTDWLGKEAKLARKEITARGLLPVLDCEVTELVPTADALRLRIAQLASEMAAGHDCDVLYQQKIEWTSALGIECAGTPDVIVVVHMRDLLKVCTIDVKHTAALGRGKLERQVAEMCWDVQGAAYREGSAAWAEAEHGMASFHLDHIILASSSIHVALPPLARPLSQAYLEGGKRRWEKAQRIWSECVATDTWPSYPEDPIEPSLYYVRQFIEAYDPTQAHEEEP